MSRSKGNFKCVYNVDHLCYLNDEIQKCNDELRSKIKMRQMKIIKTHWNFVQIIMNIQHQKHLDVSKDQLLLDIGNKENNDVNDNLQELKNQKASNVHALSTKPQ